MLVRDLPFFESHNGDYTDYCDFYVQRLKEVKSQEELASFLEAWKDLFLFETKRKPAEIVEVERQIVEHVIPLEETWRCFEHHRTGESTRCQHTMGGITCPGGHVLMPYLLVCATLVSLEFGVPSRIALHQVFCPGEPEGDHNACF